MVELLIALFIVGMLVVPIPSRRIVYGPFPKPDTARPPMPTGQGPSDNEAA